MLSVAKLSPGQEAYYERSVAQGVDDYYAGRGESPGVWAGRGAADLGLAGVVAEGDLGRLVDGVDPASGTRLRRHATRRTITVERRDAQTGLRRLERRQLDPVAGFDLVFSVPKSVSLLHALGDDATRLTIVRAHERAWQAALRYLEDEACVTRRGARGIVREPAGGFVAATFQHRTSRALDPHLHTHVVVANMAQSPDGKWRALDGQAVLVTYRLAAGYLYQAQLRAELSRSLGVEWNDPAKGMAEIRGVPREALLAFSQRRRQVVAHLEERGGSSWRAAQVAAVETRERKQHVALEALRGDWEARAAEHGFDRQARGHVTARTRWQPLGPRDLRDVAARLLGPQGLTEKQTTFGSPDLVKAWSAAHISGQDADVIRGLAVQLPSRAGVVTVEESAGVGLPARFSTRDLIRCERRGLAAVDLLVDAEAPRASAAVVDRVLHERAAAGRPLGEDQVEMVRRVATASEGVVVVVGPAGTGKTTATHTIAKAFRHAGVPMYGAAPSGHAAEKLQDETGIHSCTLHRLLAFAERDGGLPCDSVFVIDEAGMAETRVLSPVLDLVAEAHGKVVLMGDPAQLPAVGAGGLFAAVAERVGAIELTTNRRQRDHAEREALERVRAGWGREYLEWAEAADRLVRCDDPIGARGRLVADWWEAARGDLAGTVMFAFERRDVAELNAVARTLMRTEGRIGDDELAAAGLAFAMGDRVVCTRNSDRYGVRNGTRGTVESVDLARRACVVRTDRGGLVELGARYLDAGNLRHAYALTGHAGQGATVDRAFVLGHDRGRLQEWGYVALSRARGATCVYVTEPPAAPEGGKTHRAAPAIERLSEALERSSSETMATQRKPDSRSSRPERPRWASPPSGVERTDGLGERRRQAVMRALAARAIEIDR